MQVPYYPNVRQRPMSNAKLRGGATAEMFSNGSANTMNDIGKALTTVSNGMLSLDKKRMHKEEVEKKEAEREANKLQREAEKAANEQEQISYYNQLTNWDASELNLSNAPAEDREEAIGQAVSEITGGGFTSAGGVEVNKWQAMYKASMSRVDEFVGNSGLSAKKQAQLRYNLVTGELSKIKASQKEELVAQKRELKLNANQRVVTETDKLFGMRDGDFDMLDDSISSLKRAAFDKAETEGYSGGSDEFNNYCKGITSQALTSMCDELLQEGEYLKAEAIIKRYSPYLENKEIEATKDIIEGEKTVALALQSGKSESEVLKNIAPELRERVKEGFALQKQQTTEDKVQAEKLIDKAVISGEVIPHVIDLGNGRKYELSPEEIIAARKQKIELARKPLSKDAENLWHAINMLSDSEVAHRELTQIEKESLPAKFQEEYRVRKDKALTEWEVDSKEAITFISHKDRSDEFKELIKEIDPTARTELVMDTMKRLVSEGRPADEANITFEIKKKQVKHAIEKERIAKTWTIADGVTRDETETVESDITGEEFAKEQATGEKVKYKETEEVKAALFEAFRTKGGIPSECEWVGDVGANGGFYLFKRDGKLWKATPRSEVIDSWLWDDEEVAFDYEEMELK